MAITKINMELPGLPYSAYTQNVLSWILTIEGSAHVLIQLKYIWQPSYQEIFSLLMIIFSYDFFPGKDEHLTFHVPIRPLVVESL